MFCFDTRARSGRLNQTFSSRDHCDNHFLVGLTLILSRYFLTAISTRVIIPSWILLMLRSKKRQSVNDLDSIDILRCHCVADTG